MPLNGCCSESKIELQHLEEVRVLWRLSIFRFFLCLGITDEQVVQAKEWKRQKYFLNQVKLIKSRIILQMKNSIQVSRF